MPGLFDPIQIKKLAIKNRIVMPPMAMNMATPDGGVTPRNIEHYSARARGGVGLIIVEHTYVALNGRLTANQTGIYDDKLVPGLVKLAGAIHDLGAKTAIQLTHAGSRTSREIIGEQPVGPWDIPAPSDKENPRPLTSLDLKKLVMDFAEGARRAIEAGFDAVELHGAHGFLLCQFLSPFTNRRDDGYGGSWEGRLRFPLEVIAAVKRVCGNNIPLFYRFGADDLMEGGLTREEGKIVAQRLEQAGVDVIDVSGGLSGSQHSRLSEQGYFVPLAQGIKERVKVPVIGVGNITEPEYADAVVREGKVDMVAIGRKLLSTPDFPQLAAKKLGLQV